MTKEFIPHKEALAIKQLGFDEPCIAVRHVDATLLFITQDVGRDTQSEYLPTIKNSECMWEEDEGGIQEVATPTFSQAFRWLRENHGLVIDWFNGKHENFGVYVGITIKNLNMDSIFHGVYPNEEAELACLKKLIEIVKEK
jgi:hypothetical protein